MNKYLLLLIIGALSIASCADNDEPNDLTLNILLENNGNPVVGFESFDYPGGYDMFLTKFSLFISELVLVRADGTSVELKDVIHIDLLDGVQTTADAQKGYNIRVPNIPSDEFTGLSMNIGVPADLNAMEPADFNSSSALSNAGEYWVGWSSYIFHKTEGKIDTDGDGEFETNVALHLGSDAAFRSSEYNFAIDLSDDLELDLVIDINEIFKINGDYYNFEETPQIHHLGLLPKALPIMDALSTGFSIR